MSLITVIGRGHSGTRAMSQTLSASGVYMGEPLNRSGDLVPPDAMYEACRVAAQYVRWQGDLSWDWTRMLTDDIPSEFTTLINEYLASVLDSDAALKGWKIPETTLCFPWIARMFPDAKFIFWIRDPRDCIIGNHVTDDLSNFGVDCPDTDNERRQRAISWYYQYELVRNTPKPNHWIEIRFEDFVRRQDETLGRLERFLDIDLTRIPVRQEAVGRWRKDNQDPTTGPNDFPCFTNAKKQYAYAD